jgi:hypothetical protein
METKVKGYPPSADAAFIQRLKPVGFPIACRKGTNAGVFVTTPLLYSSWGFLGCQFGTGNDGLFVIYAAQKVCQISRRKCPFKPLTLFKPARHQERKRRRF